MPALAEAVVESFSTMLDAEEPSPLFSAAQIMELVSTAASTVKMLESDAQVVCHFDKIAGRAQHTFRTLHRQIRICIAVLSMRLTTPPHVVLKLELIEHCIVQLKACPKVIT